MAQGATKFLTTRLSQRVPKQVTASKGREMGEKRCQSAALFPVR
jgi:hypothetical protein